MIKRGLHCGAMERAQFCYAAHLEWRQEPVGLRGIVAKKWDSEDDFS
jgi:hypothetical protein